MTEEGLSLLIDTIRDKPERGDEGREENEISGEVDDMGPPTGGTFNVDVQLL